MPGGWLLERRLGGSTAAHGFFSGGDAQGPIVGALGAVHLYRAAEADGLTDQLIKPDGTTCSCGPPNGGLPYTTQSVEYRSRSHWRLAGSSARGALSPAKRSAWRARSCRRPAKNLPRNTVLSSL